LSKLKFYRVTGKTFLLIKSYLQDRHQKVILNDKYAIHNTYHGWGKIKHTGPQEIIPETIAFLNLPY